jgi:hypothetical protein
MLKIFKMLAKAQAFFFFENFQNACESASILKRKHSASTEAQAFRKLRLC